MTANCLSVQIRSDNFIKFSIKYKYLATKRWDVLAFSISESLRHRVEHNISAHKDFVVASTPTQKPSDRFIEEFFNKEFVYCKYLVVSHMYGEEDERWFNIDFVAKTVKVVPPPAPY